MDRTDYTRRDFLKAVGLVAVSAISVSRVFLRAAQVGGKAAGVTVLKRNKCDKGYRLYSSRQTEVAHLIDIDGREVQRWSYPQGQTWHYAEMLPDGHLVAIIKDIMILELDWDSQLVWKAEVTAHHDFDRLANGNTLVVCREYVVNEALRPGELKSDYIVELTPGGKVVWEWHADRHVQEIAALVPLEFPLANQDWGHMNTVESLPDGPAARRDARFRAGNILFSCRNIDTIGVIDRTSGKVIWAWGPGTLDKQHMPTMLPNGNILVYDNGNTLERTRILELDPLTGKILWQYQAEPPTDFYSPTRGSSQRLPNGNTLIAESDSGRLFEVTPEGEIVWEFLNPDLQQDGRRMPLYRAVRYPRDLVESILKKHGSTED
ncbi:MAG: aryl-sulfate sulfotransferase [Fidelibacterota bacterium]|nr:MAG: aryl-sulfate sulfotransferase [Candidatus Neomarinimicrobiota bacterium]